MKALVECVEFGNDRLDSLDGWQGTAWAVTTEEGSVLSLHLDKDEALSRVDVFGNLVEVSA